MITDYVFSFSVPSLFLRKMVNTIYQNSPYTPNIANGNARMPSANQGSSKNNYRIVQTSLGLSVRGQSDAGKASFFYDPSYFRAYLFVA
jgi:hypothetical protein